MRDFELTDNLHHPDDTYLSVVGVLANRDGTRSVYKRSQWEMKTDDLVILEFLEYLSCNPHPNLLPPEAFNGSLGQPLHETYAYVRQPLLDREAHTIRTALVDGRLNENDIVQLMLQLTSALSYIHQLGYVHRDARAHNIFIAVNNDRLVPTLFDYGNLCRPYFQEKGIDSWNPEMPPELVRGNVFVSPQFDVYACGYLIHSLSHRYGEFITSLDPDHPLVEVMRRSHAPLSECYSSATEMHQALLEIVKQA
jgi:serine/threonine protein kinase